MAKRPAGPRGLPGRVAAPAAPFFGISGPHVEFAQSRSTLCQSEARGASAERRRSIAMRFLGYTLASETEQPTEPPPPELYERMGKFVEEAVNAGVVVATGGLAPTPEGARVSLKDGGFTVVGGPL